ncbi:DUF523 domain-containing protein [Engelhardtia mirabilis]|uniref:Uncharacterized protein n=1 Tax=Engelhardtia mirabilis TaxID=2528011 RepID=A0A518BRY6_9BACT|nr:hypothetical protein Pla133_48480 [Planctomycetes bacterium Pla133]QDV04052.1 hypothetical protein Pla86_48460 [Planctomycetes bacterium Pla86]
MNDEHERPERVLVSACLLGRSCRYDGKDNGDQVLGAELEAQGLVAVPFCPEEHGGLGTPRPPAWLTASAEAVLDGEGQLVTDAGRDVTAQFRAGAEGALEVCQREGVRRAFLKERSPSCGCAQTHVDDRVVQGPGLTTALLLRAGIECRGVEGRRSRDDAD